MSRDDIQKLLGGYATGTLTETERQALFEAALDDQELFNALAKEQPLHDLLRDPAARAQLLAALDGPAPRWQALRRWFGRPVAVAGALAGLAVAGFFIARVNVQPERVTVAEFHAPAPALPSASISPAPAPEAPAPVPPPARQVAASPIESDTRALAKTRRAEAPAVELRTNKEEQAAAKSTDAFDKIQEAGKLTQPAETKQAETAGGPAAQAALPPAPPPKPAQAAPPAPNAPVTLGFRDTKGEQAKTDEPKVSPTSENVQVTAAANAIEQNARALFYAQQQAQTPKDQAAVAETEAAQSRKKAAARTQGLGATGMMVGGVRPARATAAVSLGVRVTVLRKDSGGAYVPADGDNLSVGDAVKLQVLPNDDGDLRVWLLQTGSMQPLHTGRAERMKPVEIPVRSPEKPGTREYLVMLVRTGTMPAGFGGYAGVDLTRMRSDQQTETDAAERATYVVNNTGSAMRVGQPIKLTYK